MDRWHEGNAQWMSVAWNMIIKFIGAVKYGGAYQVLRLRRLTRAVQSVASHW